MKNNDLFALVTGASSGIGKQMAFELGSRGKNLLIISLANQNLHEVAEGIKAKYSVEVFSLEVDLSEKDGPRKVHNWVRENQYQVDVLINNAGMAGTAIFDKSDDSYIDDRILVNVRALVFLCRYFIPDFKSLPEAYILNVGSLSAYYSIPFKSLYSATKAFVVNFSRAIRTELTDTNISVSVVCPNGVRTNEGTHARIDAHGAKGKLTSISVEDVARISLNGMYKKKFLIIPGMINWFLLFISRLMPRIMEQRILYREFYKEVMVS
jgi:uncharacterized protein